MLSCSAALGAGPDAHITGALEILEATETNDLTMARTLNSLGRIERARGQAQAARDAHARAVLLWEKALGPGHAELGIGQYNLARDHEELGQFEEAMLWYERAVALLGAIDGAQGSEADANFGLAKLLARGGETDRARTSAEKARALHAAAGVARDDEIGEVDAFLGKLEPK